MNQRPRGRLLADGLEAACGAVVLTVKVAVALVVELLSVTDAVGWPPNAHEIPVAAGCGGTKAQVRFMVPLKPLVELTVTVEGPDIPADDIVIGVAETAYVTAVVRPGTHAATRLFTSSEPKPVAKS
jgi:hypothetical protein